MSKEATQYQVDAHIPSPESLEVLAAMTYDGQYEDDGDEDGSSQSQPRLAELLVPRNTSGDTIVTYSTSP